MNQTHHSNQAAPMLPIIEKLTHVNHLDLISAKFKQAVIDAELIKDENKALQMQNYSDWLHSAAKYIIVRYDEAERHQRVNLDYIRTIGWQEMKIKQLESEMIKLKKVIENI